MPDAPLSLKDLFTSLCPSLTPVPTEMEPSLSMIPDIRCVLFDIYGTLVISAAGDIGTMEDNLETDPLVGALKDSGMAARHPLSAADAGLLHEVIAGFHHTMREEGIAHPEIDILSVWRETLARLSHEGLLSDKIDDQALERLAVDYECRINPVSPMPGLENVLAGIRQSGRLLGIVSNAQFYTPIMLETFLGQPLVMVGFEPELCAWSYQMGEAKPSSSMFKGVLTALREREITPFQTLVVGNDMLNDIWTASQAGCRTCLFAGDARSLRLRKDDARCRDLKPDAVITSLEQLEKILS